MIYVILALDESERRRPAPHQPTVTRPSAHAKVRDQPVPGQTVAPASRGAATQMSGQAGPAPAKKTPAHGAEHRIPSEGRSLHAQLARFEPGSGDGRTDIAGSGSSRFSLGRSPDASGRGGRPAP